MIKMPNQKKEDIFSLPQWSVKPVKFLEQHLKQPAKKMFQPSMAAKSNTVVSSFLPAKKAAFSFIVT
jgi:hypothetical protein